MHHVRRRLSPSRILKRPRRARSIVALAIGLAAVPTVALAATDAVPGDPFKLGQENRITNATTTLTGTTATGPPPLKGVLQVRRESGIGPALKVENKTTGIGGQAVDIEVGPNRAPIRVNPDAGTASNLSADKLDGKDEEDFLNASRVYKVGSPLAVGPGGGGTEAIFVRCDGDDIAIGFSALPRDEEDTISSISSHFIGYFVEFQDNGAQSNFTAEVICSDNAKPFK